MQETICHPTSPPKKTRKIKSISIARFCEKFTMLKYHISCYININSVIIIAKKSNNETNTVCLKKPDCYN